MKKRNFVLGLAFSFLSLFAWGQTTTYVSGYYKSDGTYVQGHYRTVKNSTNWDNYSTQYNVNPYTGNSGYRARDYSTDVYNYGKNKVIYTGPQGGQYYINAMGTKTYVPKRSNPYAW